MYTLLRKHFDDQVSATGLFPTKEAAYEWAQTFVPEMTFTVIELLLAPATRDDIDAADLWTWSAMSVAPVAKPRYAN